MFRLGGIWILSCKRGKIWKTFYQIMLSHSGISRDDVIADNVTRQRLIFE